MLSKFTPLRNSLFTFRSFGGDRVYDISSVKTLHRSWDFPLPILDLMLRLNLKLVKPILPVNEVYSD
ncbi:hypothetical protein IQ264_20360 [Phormidium sp. LEGE 05292]|uniref:hypothetical protein n=1 Tax=[Phormidium] sp. LEGE 05292 TaxID=767427 RepID=UPI0018813A67|nr:hypothetical protein [Phormidium sp. LEGE 05292]MBE9227782.1 hypothetical protein [Phormidium sp. LEGE 05292]